MSGDRAVRSLLNLSATASTARMLSLHAVWKRCGDTADYSRAPFFRSHVLNRSIIVKHRLREHEKDDFTRDRRTVTKIILPIDPSDLRHGARSFFVGQAGYTNFIDEIQGPKNGDRAHDVSLLEILDGLPSLDPFLMRECLQKAGFNPARCYFDLSDADNQRISRFVQNEVAPLIGISFRGQEQLDGGRVEKFARLLLEDATDSSLQPLRQSMNMQPDEFVEGVFCWKGFLYYKWALMDLFPKVKGVLEGLGKVQTIGPVSYDDRAFLDFTRKKLVREITLACQKVKTTIGIYETAYEAMTSRGNAAAFRDFLVGAPAFFNTLGDNIGAVNHIVSFWGYRFPPGARLKMLTEDLVDLFSDFEASVIEAQSLPASPPNQDGQQRLSA